MSIQASSTSTGKSTMPPPIPPRPDLSKKKAAKANTGDSFQKSATASTPATPQPVLPSLSTLAQTILEKFPNAPLAFHESVHTAGDLSHTLWGSKPMASIGADNENVSDADSSDDEEYINDTSWIALKDLVKSGAPVQDNFILLDTPELGSLTGLVINKENLRATLREHPSILDPWPNLKKGGIEALIQKFESYNDISALLNDHTAFGTLLGYGPNNARKYATPGAKGTYNIRKAATAEIDQDSSQYKVSIPKFMARDDSPETEGLIHRYRDDSRRIRDELEQQHKLEPAASLGKSKMERKTAYYQFITRQVLKTLFKVTTDSNRS